jgi:uncharacterized protein (TIGR02466 family)
MDINNIFSSFLAIDTLSTIDNLELKRYAKDLKTQGDGVIKSNFLGWQSDTLTVPSSQIDLLVKEILARAEDLKSIIGFKKEYNFYLSNLWINISQTSAFNRPHIHSDSILSGVYYVDCVSNSGQIVFLHPSIAQKILINESALDSFTKFSASTNSVTPEIGRLVLFPSWLEHYVEPNLNIDERISVAFNISIGKQ